MKKNKFQNKFQVGDAVKVIHDVPWVDYKGIVIHVDNDRHLIYLVDLGDKKLRFKEMELELAYTLEEIEAMRVSLIRLRGINNVPGR